MISEETEVNSIQLNIAREVCRYFFKDYIQIISDTVLNF